ncbi:protransforming growth factor alpha isoform X1 [Oreochromis aureus]|uniref:EGF-like domain-containing protein n=1 Tax=Oreochromis aureus TaxID=47969 RepID=A0A668UBR3_OREAU|nr:protransforming growth factor alpha isoform X1 [Oreochromis aureus]XP_039467869.1 protransforming growth factor alpha isoform X1 [Oreochromis aureus]
MMTRIFWETILLISGSLFTFGAGHSSSVTIEANISISINSTAPPDASSSSSATTSSRSTSTTIPTTSNIPTVKSSLFIVGPRQTNATITDATISINATSSAAANTSASSSSTNTSSSATKSLTGTTTTNIHPVKKFVAAAVRSHFDDCPDSHRHFCFHGTCRFLILEETPACVCHPGFIGMRCEHADLLAVVATNHRQQTIATVLVLCVIGCVLIMVLCTVLHCWWRQDCRRRSHAHHYVTEKHGVSCCPSESVV